MLESFDPTKGGVNAISIFWLGRADGSSRDPITVFISMDDEEAPYGAWIKVRSDIQADLNTLPYDLTAHIE